MASDSPQAAPRTLGEKVVTGGWISLAIVIFVSFCFSSEPFDFSTSLALLSLITFCAAFACWPSLFLNPINYRSLCDDVPRGSQIAMSAFVGLTVLRAFVELVA